MSGHDPGSHAQRDGQSASSSSANGDRTIEAMGASLTSGQAPPTAVTKTWVGGRLALIVAGIGLVGAALGGIWFGVAERSGLNPGGMAGSVLVVVSAALLAIGLLLLVGGLG